jgi:hypothetical protein
MLPAQTNDIFFFFLFKRGKDLKIVRFGGASGAHLDRAEEWGNPARFP